MLLTLYHEYLGRGKPLQHYFHHYLISTAGLLIAINIYGSVTAWEVLLFYIGSFILFADEMLYAIINYVEQTTCRRVINTFIIGDYIHFFSLLHDNRKFYSTLAVHNVLTYASLVVMVFALLVFEVPVGFYFVFGLITHLSFDIGNDVYELKSLTRWIWPTTYI